MKKGGHQKSIQIKSKIKPYQVSFTEDLSFIKEFNTNENIFLVDSKVYDIYKNKIFTKKSKNIVKIQANENSKTLDYAKILYKKFLTSHIRKKSTIISIGGGVTQDISGFVASTFYRGIKWIYIPTTLLAQSDSCIGSKSSINFDSSKNLIGTFYPPSLIYININFINSISDKDFESGLGEIIKIHLINIKKNEIKKLSEKVKIIKTKKTKKDLTEIVSDSLKIKKFFIETDEFDTGIRNILNYGHTFGHALESTSNFQLPHGIAVLIGIAFANLISRRRKMISEENFELINKSLIFPNINKNFVKKDYFSTESLLDRVKSDKKRRTGNLSFIIPNSALKLVKKDDITKAEFSQTLNDFRKTIFPQLLK